MKFTPKKEGDLKKSFLLEKGEYDFEVLQAEDAISKASGNEMIKLTLGVFAPDGSQVYIYDYLLESIEYKLKHFCDATGLMREYETGTLTADMCVNRTGRCSLGVQKDKTGLYDPKNVIKDYHPADCLAPSEDMPPPAIDDVPF